MRPVGRSTGSAAPDGARDQARHDREGRPAPTARDGLTFHSLLGRLTAVMVCHCEAVNDVVIRDEIAAGALDSEALADRCGAGTRCGGCVSVVEQLLAQFGLGAEAVAA
jgi:bacterioferritin-associated ferredoxin